MVNVKCPPKAIIYLTLVISFITISAIIAVLASASNVADDSNEATVQDPKGGKGQCNVVKELWINILIEIYENSSKVG